ncbi:MAG: hypothetical protein H7251_07680 [Acetobacteraceae bacterium]|nr:hypothetical protein [Acetobacteraceae bacterium]
MSEMAGLSLARVTLLAFILAGCQPTTTYQRDIAGQTAVLAKLPAIVPIEQQFRHSDWMWSLGVATCVTAAHKSGPVGNERDLARYCACNFDLMQTRMSAEQFALIGRPERPGLLAQEEALRRRQKIADACQAAT